MRCEFDLFSVFVCCFAIFLLLLSLELFLSQFDDGGPLLFTDTLTGRSFLIGLFSYGVACASRMARVLSRMTNYLSWVLATTNGTANYCIVWSPSILLALSIYIVIFLPSFHQTNHMVRSKATKKKKRIYIHLERRIERIKYEDFFWVNRDCVWLSFISLLSHSSFFMVIFSRSSPFFFGMHSRSERNPRRLVNITRSCHFSFSASAT